MDKIIKVSLPDGVSRNVEAGTSIAQILNSGRDIGGPLAAIVNGDLTELGTTIDADSDVVPVTGSDLSGYWVYARSVSFLFMIAVSELFKGAAVTIEHAINNEFYGEISYERDIGEEDIRLIKSKMLEIVSCDSSIEKVFVKKEEAAEIFLQYGMEDKLRLLKHAIGREYVSLYRCRGVYDYFYGPMVPSMGYLKLFDVVSFGRGFALLVPGIKKLDFVPPVRNMPKLRQVYDETKKWSDILDVTDVGALNEKILSGQMKDILLVAEGLQEKKISRIADMIFENINTTKIILIAGPSSSGKTTFSKRLSIQLRVLGLKPHNISMDDYFVGRDLTPKKKNGEYDFESIKAVDVALLNEHLNELLGGGEIEMVRFNFITGQRELAGQKYRMDSNSILIVEGIHGLNEESTHTIPSDGKYKIYVSALTQLNLDKHNSIYVSDIRMLRRMVRDNRTRGRDAETTILTWGSVRGGEEKNIFPFQEEANIMFNSTLIYEMSILKKYAEPLLREIRMESAAYPEARRLLKILGYFEEGDEGGIPENSIIREFIGGSCFE